MKLSEIWGVILMFILIIVGARSMNRFDRERQEEENETILSNEAQGRFWSKWGGSRS